MFRKILSVIFALFMFLPNAHSAEMVNVEYIHQYLNARWGIDLPYNPELKNPRVAANMKYLLTVVDIANEYLNGEKTTNYGNGTYATLAAADTVATNTAIDTLVDAPTFTITTTPGTSSFGMLIGAAGNFIIDWGDGKRDVIADKPVGATTYSHTYSASGEYEIKLTGRATGYSGAATDAAVSFYTNANARSISKISGSLGKIFPTLPDGSQPKFYQTFYYASNLTEIPADLFAGIRGAPAEWMFSYTFSNTAVTSIPANLFGTLNGDGARSMFERTFYGCQNLTTADGPLFSGTITPAEWMFFGTFSSTAITSIPANLFGTLNGDGAPSMFFQTFSGCTNLTTVDGPLFSGTITPAESMFAGTFSGSTITSIPANLFGTLNGDGAPSMFNSTFSSCKNLTTVGGPLFSGTLTPAENMFGGTFAYTGITEIPAYLFGELNGNGAMGMFSNTFAECADLTTVGGPLFSGTLTPAESMFGQMFYKSGITSIPENIFGNLNGDGAPSMFERTFNNCENLTTVDGPLFSGTITPAERMFYWTFNNTAITSIPANLFGTLNGDGAPMMFAQTFFNCKNLTTADGSLFSGTITPAESMFYYTFSDTAITEIPADLFAGIQGAPAESMFYYTFYNTALTEIPADLFAGIQGAPARSMFDFTFWQCNQLQSIPENLFAGIHGAPAERMFSGTFYNTALTEIPADLFAGIQGAPADSMFYRTFSNTAVTSIPANLFGTLNGDGAPSMFERTFYECTNLTTVGGPLFSGTLTPAENMFSGTFSNTALTEIPADLFAGIQGAPAEDMFDSTFYSCSELQSIPENLFAGISGPAATDMFAGTFVFCFSLTGPSARTNGQYLYEIWPDVSNLQTYMGATGLSDYDQIPSNWK